MSDRKEQKETAFEQGRRLPGSAEHSDLIEEKKVHRIQKYSKKSGGATKRGPFVAGKERF